MRLFILMIVFMYHLCTEAPGALKEAPVIHKIGLNFVDLTWSPPEYDGGSFIIGYRLERLDMFGQSWMAVSKQFIGSTSYRFDDLVDRVQYVFRVRAVNNFGTGRPSPSSDPFVCGHACCELYVYLYYLYAVFIWSSSVDVIYLSENIIIILV